MFSVTVDVYAKLLELYTKVFEEKKALMEENEELKEMLESTRHDLFYTREQNRFLSESLADLQNQKRKDLEKRIADLEEQLAKKVFLLDDEGTPIKSFTLTGKLTLLEEPTEEKLEVGKWYDARTFDEATLKKLLPVGTFVSVLTDWHEDEKRKLPKVDECFKVNAIVTSVEGETTGWDGEETAVYVDRYKIVPNYWFKILKEY